MVKDFMGNPVEVGDTVIFTAYNDNGVGLLNGIVEKVNKVTVEVRYAAGRYGTTRKGAGYFFKVEPKEVTNG
ncbi:hypothetical protein phiPccP1_00028 [Pectobacterium phage phiPccP-1]|nr:hypothetical protein phiPccP1_00028 [Pectobacterium phage phiPccP-1]